MGRQSSAFAPSTAPRRGGHDQDRRSGDAALRGAPEHLSRDDVVDLDRRCEHSVVGLLGDHPGVHRIDPFVGGGHHARGGDQSRGEEGEVADPVHLADEAPETEPQAEQVEEGLAEVEQQAGQHQAAPHQHVAAPHRERDRLRRRKAPVPGGFRRFHCVHWITPVVLPGSTYQGSSHPTHELRTRRRFRAPAARTSPTTWPLPARARTHPRILLTRLPGIAAAEYGRPEATASSAESRRTPDPFRPAPQARGLRSGRPAGGQPFAGARSDYNAAHRHRIASLPGRCCTATSTTSASPSRPSTT